MTANDLAQKDSYYLKPRTLLHNGQYRTEKVLGHGGFGITYLALDMHLNQKVALKEYFPQGYCGRETTTGSIQLYGGQKNEFYNYGLERYIEEARNLANFNHHPGIVSVYNYFQENNTAYMIMQYLEGQTVREWVKKRGDQVSWDEAMSIMNPVLDTLKAMHETGLIHRDISPDNIYICDNSQIKVLDLGAARVSLGEQSHSLSVILKQGYTPFEQYTTRGKQGPWTDLYAAAATIYRMVSGQILPIATDRVVEDEIPALILNSTLIPHDYKSIMIKALAPMYNQRYQSIESFQLDLQQADSKISAGNAWARSDILALPVSTDSSSPGAADPVHRNRWLPQGLTGLQALYPPYKWPQRPIDSTVHAVKIISAGLEEEVSVFQKKPWLLVTLIVCILLIGLMGVAGLGWYLYKNGLISF